MAIVTRTDGKKYRERLTKFVKLAGQMVIDMADDIVGNSDSISDLNINITFNQDIMCSLPEVIITRSHVPKGKDVQLIFENEEES